MTTPVYLVRHAKAGSRARWTEPDRLRPLTKPGRRQAEGLVELLAEQPLSRLLSSPYVRCLQTLDPLARSRDLPVEKTEHLAEGAPVDVVLELMLSVAGDGPAALSTHGDVMIFAVETLIAAGIPAEGPGEFKKGSTWVFDVRDGAFALLRYLPPPPDKPSISTRRAARER